MSVTPRVLVAFTVALAGGVLAPGARADVTKDQCIDANASAQRLRLAGKLGAAHRALLTCADSACPGMVRDDCSRRLDELDRAQPTIILDVKDPVGNDLTDVRVNDGTPLTDRLDGVARRVDPGVHVFTFEVGGQPVATRKLVIQESEKGRRETIVIAPATVAPSPDQHREGGVQGRRLLGLGVGGVGVAGVVVGSIFGGLADAAWHDQKSACGSPASCTNAGHAAALSDHTSLTTDGAVSTTAFIAGGALLAAGIVLFLTAPPRAATAGRLTIVPAVGPGQASIAVTARF
jgi:hypothetical protein